MKMETLRVTKEDIDNVIFTSFSKVFAQNQINDEWEEYWEHVVKTIFKDEISQLYEICIIAII